MLRRSLTAAAVPFALVLGTTACGNDAPAPTPTTKSPTSSPTPTAPAWESKYTEAELQSYRTALQRFADYEKVSEPIWASGKLTSEAQAIFESYWHVPQIPHVQLQQYEKNGVKVSGLPQVISQRLLKINKDIELQIEQCVDGDSVTVTQRGEVVQGSAKPFRRVIAMDKPKDSQWLIVRVLDPSNMGGAKPCREE